MAIYEFELPDGTVVEAEGDDGLSQEQAQAMAMQHPDVQAYFANQQPRQEIPPMQSGGIPIPSDQEDMVGYGAELTPEEQLMMAQTAGAIGGTALSGGNPFGGAAGFALADQLYNKYMNQQEITPTSAAMSFGEGALYELLPRGVIKGMGVAAKATGASEIPKRLMARALQLPPKTEKDIADRIVAHALENNLSISRGNLAKAGKVAAENAEKVSERVAELSRQGKTVDPMAVVRGMRKNMKDPWEKGDLTKDQRKLADEWADKLYAQYQSEFGVSLTGAPQHMDIATALSRKRANDAFAVKEHLKATQTGKSTADPGQPEAWKATADSYRNLLNQDDIIAAANKEASEMYRFGEHAMRRLLQGERTNLLSSQIYMPALLESMYKGGPGIATALGITRAGTGNPWVISKGANLLNKLSRVEDVVPPMYQTQALHQLFRAYAEDTKKEGKK